MHDDSVMRLVPPYLPPGHRMHVDALAAEYVPAGHGTWVAVVDPAGHAYPAVQAPVHVVKDTPATPYRPPGHTPLQVGVVSPVAAPYRPAEQRVHAPTPPGLHCPAAHKVALVDAAGHAVPGGQTPLQLPVVKPAVAPKRPKKHGEQMAASAALHCPATHSVVVGDVDPAAQA